MNHVHIALPPYSTYTGSDKPTLLKLMAMKEQDGSDLKVVETIAAGGYELFGMFLLHDENGVAVDLLKKNHIHEGVDSIAKAIIKKWLTDASPTAPCTYQHFIECLRHSHLGALADSIEAVVKGNMRDFIFISV